MGFLDLRSAAGRPLLRKVVRREAQVRIERGRRCNEGNKINISVICANGLSVTYSVRFRLRPSLYLLLYFYQANLLTATP